MTNKPGILQIIRNSLWNPKADEKRYLSYSDAVLQGQFLSSQTSSGELVTEDRGGRISTVFNCVNLIAQDVAQTPVNIHQGTGEDKITLRDNLSRLIKNYPNEKMSAYSFWYANVWNYLVWGNSFNVIIRDGNRQPMELLPINPMNVRIEEIGRELYINIRGWDALIPYSDVMHFKLYSFDGVRGVSPIIHNAEIMGKKLKEIKYASRNLGNVPPMYLTSQDATEDQVNSIKTQWQQSIHGEDQRGVPFLIGGIEAKKLPIPPNELQYIETSIQTNKEIYGIYRVNPTLISNFDQGVQANAEQQAINHVKYTLMPHFTMIEQELNCKLFAQANKLSNNPRYVKHNVNNFLRGDASTRYKIYHDMILDGVMNADEVRAKEDMGPQPDGLGKKYYVQGAMIEKGTEINKQENE